MSNHGRTRIAWLVLFVSVVFTARAEELRPAMERANAEFIEAFNRPNPAGFAALYTPDAVLLFGGLPPKTGPRAIMQFWESRIKAGARDHTFEILDAWADGKYAFQFAKAGVQLVPPTGQKTTISGYTVRIFERQSDGTWKTKVHMFNPRVAPSRAALNRHVMPGECRASTSLPPVRIARPINVVHFFAGERASATARIPAHAL
jgi:ketosteroid isomerase-like protein